MEVESNNTVFKAGLAITDQDDVKFSMGFRPYVPSKNGGSMLLQASLAPGQPVGYVHPVWYSGWRDETLSWHETCSFSALLNPTPVTIIRGPEAKKFLKENFVNNIDNFPIGIIKHGLLCLENGMLATHGVLMHTAEDVYEAHWHAPYINYLFQLKKYDAELTDISPQRYLYQLQGPRCLEILEQITGDDLHDIKYRHFRASSIDGHEVRILRFGMAGTLGYEIHGDSAYAKEVFKKILATGRPYGLRPIGMFTYGMNHIEGGFPQIGVNIISAMCEDEGFIQYLAKDPYSNPMCYMTSSENIECLGSAGPDPHNFMYNPFEIGLGGCINWNHEFRGKKALRKLKESEDKDVATLRWNPEDLCRLYAMQFDPDAEYVRQLDLPCDLPLFGYAGLTTDWVYDSEGKKIGRSYGRVQSNYYHAVLSFGAIARRCRGISTEVYILRGEPGTHQIKIRATVERFPYNTHLVNDGYDVETIPHYKAK
ncbi:MAG: hypothetical protein LBG57_12400 [Treponema sp.]|jgi:glycine cleavage system aminomethyltransferase T|nr:hypothetical protein [Treponema sp.]